VPRYQQDNALPPGFDPEAMARHVRDAAGELEVLRIPTPVGFCMLVRRDAMKNARLLRGHFFVAPA
jgi:hypothetical protein